MATRETHSTKQPVRWFAQGRNGEFFLTLFGKRFGTSHFETEPEAREAAVLWNQSNDAADADEVRWGVE